MPGCSATGTTADPSMDAAPSPAHPSTWNMGTGRAHSHIPGPLLMLGTQLALSVPSRGTAEPQDPRCHEHRRGGGWSTASFLEAPTPFLDATQHLLPGLIQIRPSWSAPEPGSCPATCNLLTKAVIEDSFLFQQVLWESQVSLSWRQADSSPGPDCPCRHHKTQPSTQRSPPQRTARRPLPRLSMPRVRQAQAGMFGFAGWQH